MSGVSTYPFGVFDPAAVAAYRDSFAGLPDTVIGHDCWIGHSAMVRPGVRVGNGVIVGAGAVVARDVPDYHIVAGNPARVIRARFAPDVIARLLDLAWWDWPVERIARAVPALAAGDPAALADLAG